MTDGGDESGFQIEVVPGEVYAYMNRYGRIICIQEYNHLKSNPKTAWVIERHWSIIVPLIVPNN